MINANKVSDATVFVSSWIKKLYSNQGLNHRNASVILILLLIRSPNDVWLRSSETGLWYVGRWATRWKCQSPTFSDSTTLSSYYYPLIYIWRPEAVHPRGLATWGALILLAVFDIWYEHHCPVCLLCPACCMIKYV